MDPTGSISAHEWPSVAVVMPVRNEAAAIEASLRAALDQAYPGRLEVVVADGMSDDATADIVAAIASTDPRIALIDNPEATAPAGMNVGIGATDAEVIVRCDGHAILPPGYVATAVEVLLDTGSDNVGGLQNVVGTTPMERAIAAGMSSPAGVGNARFRTGGQAGPVDTVYLGVFRRSTLEAVGGFDETMVRNQDYELNHRIRLSGGTVYFDPRLAVAYRPRSTLRGLWRQYFDYGRGKRTMLRKHPSSLRPRQLAPPLLVLAFAASAALVFTQFRSLSLVVPTLYGIAVAVVGAIETVKHRDPAMLRIVGVIPTMHISWGSGFLFGRRLRSSQ